MRKIFTIILFLFTAALSEDKQEETNMFTEFENAVGYIKTNDGRKFIVIETPSGAKLIKVNEEPENVLKGNKGISKEDFQNQ